MWSTGVEEVVAMAFVLGHARDTGWVVAHVRRPHRARDGQLPLLIALPSPRVPGSEEREALPPRPLENVRAIHER